MAAVVPQTRACIAHSRRLRSVSARRRRGRFQEIWIEYIIIIHKDQHLASGLTNPAEPRRRKAELLLTDDSRSRMPGKIDPSRNRFVTPIVHHDQFPSVARERLVFKRAEALPK